jgi:hypothetical protein
MAGLMPAATGLTKDSPIDGLNSLGTTSVRDSLPRQGRRRPTLTVTGFDRGRNARPAPFDSPALPKRINYFTISAPIIPAL